VIAGLHTGIAPDAKIVSLRTQTSSGTSVRVYRDALDDIVRHAWDPSTPAFRTAIVNLSGGLPMPTQDDVPLAEIESRIRTMIGGVDRDGHPDPAGKRFLFVVAAGNLGQELGPVRGQCSLSGQVLLWPAVLGPTTEGLVTVGGATRDDRWWSGSCGGPAVEVAGPAEDLLLATITGRDHYRGPEPNESRSGTSYATAYVSGIAARLLEADPSASPAELERQLEASPSRLLDGGGLPVPVIAPVSTPRRRIAR
jgi:subtilisin family serine protease